MRRSTSAATIGSIHLGVMRDSLLQLCGNVLGVQFVALEEFQAGL
jgi:hypothetical protein